MKCRKLESGKWECYAEGPRDPLTNKRNPIRKQAVKKTVAQAKVTAALQELTSGYDSRRANSMTFSELADEWIAAYKLTGVKNNTLSSRQSSVNLVAAYMGNIAIGRATHQLVQDILTDLFNQGKSKSTLDHTKVTMKFVFQHAVKLKLRSDNPVTHTIIPKRRQTVEDIENEELDEKFFERDELELFLSTADRCGLLHDREWFLLLAFTGLRAGEMCALKWSDIDFENHTLRVTKTMENINGYKSYQVTPPKTLDSIRVLDIDEDIVAMLKRVKRMQAEHRMKFQRDAAHYHDENFIFTRPKDGYPYSPRFIYRRSLRICKKAGMAKEVGPHILRHTHVTMLTEAGLELHVIMERVGHVNAKTTRNIYTHVSKRVKKEAAEMLSHQYGEIFKSYSGG